jgi:hypothetical protein
VLRLAKAALIVVVVLAAGCAGDDDGSPDVAAGPPGSDATEGVAAGPPGSDATEGDATEVDARELPGSDGAWERVAGPSGAPGEFPAVVVGAPDLVYVWGTGAGVGGWSFDPVASTWTALPPAPVEPLTDVLGAWAGDELLVWGLVASSLGPGTTRSLGARFDPATSTWRAVPDHAVGFGHAWWTGSVVLVLHEDAGTVALSTYDPRTDTWTGPTATPLSEVAWAASASWTGTELLVHDEVAGVDRGYDPATAAWRTLPAAPRPDFVFSRYAWLGDEWWQIGGGVAEGDTVREEEVTFALDPAAGTWRTVDDDPGVGGTVLALDAGAQVVTGFGEPAPVWRYDAGGGFTPLDPLPLTYRLAWSAGRLVAVGLGPDSAGAPTLDALVYVPGSDAPPPTPLDMGVFTTTTLEAVVSTG